MQKTILMLYFRIGGRTMIMIKIIRTSKSYDPKDKYICFDRETKHFLNISETMRYLNAHYGNCKRSNIYYEDNQQETTKKVGYIYHFRNNNIGTHPIQKWLQQDWVKFFEYEPMEL